MKVDLMDDECGTLVFECPGCRYGHMVTTKKRNACGSMWTFDGNFAEPTLTPSVVTNPQSIDGPRCHAFVTKGRITFLHDSEHSLSGQTVDLPDL